MQDETRRISSDQRDTQISRLAAWATLSFATPGLITGVLAIVSLIFSIQYGRAQTPDTFNPGSDGTIFTVAVQPDGKVLAGGHFYTLDGANRTYIGRLNPDGTLDPTFQGSFGAANSFAVQTNGKILVAGGWISRLNQDGSPDSPFYVQTHGDVHCLALQSDDKIVVGGDFDLIGYGLAPGGLARLNTDGLVELAWQTTDGVYALAPSSGNKTFFGGAFTRVSGLRVLGVVLLGPDGDLNPGFNSVPISGQIHCLAVQPDGKILVAGWFDSIGGIERNNIGRLNADGSLDLTFTAEANEPIFTLALQTDGKIIVGGSFTELCGQPRNYIGRLNPDGSLDTAFHVDADYYVYSLALQEDGRILAAGPFTALGGQPRHSIGRLINPDPATQTLEFDGARICWLRGGSSPEVWRTSFEASTDGTNWVNLGAGKRIPAGWELSGVCLPAAATLRARGFVTGDGTSSWFVETTLPVPAQTPKILATDGAFNCSSNQFNFKVTGSTGQIVVVETSTNLFTWTPVVTNTIATNPVPVSDSVLPESPHRFYRARVP